MASFFKDNKASVTVDVIAGRFEGLFAYLALISKNNIPSTDLSKTVYYEVGGASAQLVWKCPSKINTDPEVFNNKAHRRFIKKFKKFGKSNRSLGYIKTKSGADFDYYFSLSFLGLGAEKFFNQLLEAKTKSFCYNWIVDDANNDFVFPTTSVPKWVPNDRCDGNKDTVPADRFKSCTNECLNILKSTTFKDLVELSF